MENPVTFRQKVEDIISQKVSPALQLHGGDLYVKDIKDGNVWVVFTGTCKTCPAAQLTIEEVVERSLRAELGEQLANVYLVNETDEELLDFAKKLLNKNK